MEPKNNKKINYKEETIKINPQDGIVPQKVIQPISTDTHRKYFKGHATTKVFTTNDPRISRIFTYGFCALFNIWIYTFIN